MSCESHRSLGHVASAEEVRALPTGWGNAIFENTGILNGGSGEGTIFTFTSSSKPKCDEHQQAVTCGGNGTSITHLRDYATLSETCMPPKRYQFRRSRSPYRIRIDFRELLSRNGMRTGKSRRSVMDGKLDSVAVTGIEGQRLDWNHKSKQLAEQFDSRRQKNDSVFNVLLEQTSEHRGFLGLEHTTPKDMSESRLQEMASKIREQEECREALWRENALLRKQLERVKSGSVASMSAEEDVAQPDSKRTENAQVLVQDKGNGGLSMNRSRQEKPRRSKGNGVENRRNHLSIERMLGERSHVIDKRRNTKAWLKSGFFDFCEKSEKAPVARSFISLKGGVPAVGQRPLGIGFKKLWKRNGVRTKGGKMGSRRTKGDCNGHDTPGTVLVADQTMKEKIEDDSRCGEKYVGDIFMHAERLFSASKSCDSESTSRAVQDVGLSVPSASINCKIYLSSENSDLGEMEKPLGPQIGPQIGELQGSTDGEEISHEETQHLREPNVLSFSGVMIEGQEAKSQELALEPASQASMASCWTRSHLEPFGLAFSTGSKQEHNNSVKEPAALSLDTNLCTTAGNGWHGTQPCEDQRGEAETTALNPSRILPQKQVFCMQEQPFPGNSQDVNAEHLCEDDSNGRESCQTGSGVGDKACRYGLPNETATKRIALALQKCIDHRLAPVVNVVVEDKLVSAQTSLEVDTSSSCSADESPGIQEPLHEAMPEWTADSHFKADYQLLKEDEQSPEKETEVVDEGQFPVQATGFKAMLKDFHMKERCLSKLRRMPIMFRSKNGLSHNWLRLSQEKKASRKDVGGRSAVLPKKMQKRNVSASQAEDRLHSNGNACSSEEAPCHSTSQYDGSHDGEESDAQCGQQQSHQSMHHMHNGLEGPVSSPRCPGDSGEHETPESQQLMSCCSFNGLPLGFGSYVHSDKQASGRNRDKAAPPPLGLDCQDGSRPISLSNKMKGILDLRKDKFQSPNHNGHCYTSLSLIVDKENGPACHRKSRSPDRGRSRECPEGGGLHVMDDGYSEHDSVNEGDTTRMPEPQKASRPVQKDSSCTREVPVNGSSVDEYYAPRAHAEQGNRETSLKHSVGQNRSGGSKIRSQKDGCSSCLEDVAEDELRPSQLRAMHICKDIPPAEQVFLERFSTLSTDESGPSSTCSKGGMGPLRVAPSLDSSSHMEISALTSLLLENSARKADLPSCSRLEPKQRAQPLCETVRVPCHDGIRCQSAPSSCLPHDNPLRPVTAFPLHGGYALDPTSVPRNYDPSAYFSPSKEPPSFPCSIPTTDFRPQPFVPLSASSQLPHMPAENCAFLKPERSTVSTFGVHPQQDTSFPWPHRHLLPGQNLNRTIHSLHHPYELVAESCLPDIPVMSRTAGTVGPLQPHSAWPVVPMHLKPGDVSMSFHPHNLQGSPGTSGSYEMNFQQSSLDFHSRQEPNSTHPNLYLSQEAVFPLKKQAHDAHSIRSFPNTTHGPQCPPAVPYEMFPSCLDIPCTSASHSLQQPKDATAAVAPSSGSSTPQQMLWLSEEETEIIRHIRLSKFKGTTASPFSALSGGPSAVRGGCSNNHELAGSFHGRTGSRCSNLSACSADDSVLPPDDGTSIKEGDSNWKTSAEEDKLPFPVDDKRQLEKQTNMVIAVCRHSAATCIQKWWKKCMQQKRAELKQDHIAALRLAEMPEWLRQLPDLKLQTASKLRGMNVQVTNQRRLLQTRYSLLQQAAITIQRWWRKLKQQRRLASYFPIDRPSSLKSLYNRIRARHLSRGVVAPTYNRFLRLVERVQAATEGARVRHRLKSRRLQAMIMEIKEIRALLMEMSLDPARESPPNLLAQLYNQLQQKLLQLRTALNGPEKDARFVLRRSPASPLVIYTTRPGSSGLPGGAPPKFGDPVLLKSSTSSLPDTLNFANLHLQSGDDKKRRAATAPKTSHISLVANSTQPAGQKTLQGSVGYQQIAKRSAEWAYAQIYQPKDDGTSTKSNRAVLADEVLQRFSQSDESLEQNFRIQMQRMLEHSTGLDEQYDDSEYGEQPDRPKRPYLKRKSIMMAPQKLDWSKVKPMVRSRLEPELRTKLSHTKPKGVNVSSSRKVTTDYNKVKSRLFNYESKETSLQASADSSKTGTADENKSDAAVERTGIPKIKDSDCSKKDIKPGPSANDLLGAKVRGNRSLDAPAPAKVKLEGESQQKAEDKGGKPRQHSNRYGNSSDVPQQVKDECSPPVETFQDTALPVKPAKPDEGWVASVQLERTLKGVMGLKHGKGVTLECLFRPAQDKSIVPRLNPASNVLNASKEERNILYHELCNDGNAYRN